EAGLRISWFHAHGAAASLGRLIHELGVGEGSSEVQAHGGRRLVPVTSFGARAVERQNWEHVRAERWNRRRFGARRRRSRLSPLIAALSTACRQREKERIACRLHREVTALTMRPAAPAARITTGSGAFLSFVSAAKVRIAMAAVGMSTMDRLASTKAAPPVAPAPAAGTPATDAFPRPPFYHRP